VLLFAAFLPRFCRAERQSGSASEERQGMTKRLFVTGLFLATALTSLLLATRDRLTAQEIAIGRHAWTE
jgi:hypothetical protein